MRAQWNRDDLERAEHGQLRFTQEQANLIRAKAIQLGWARARVQSTHARIAILQCRTAVALSRFSARSVGTAAAYFASKALAS